MEVMKANIAYKFELMPTREQTRIFAQAHRVPAFCLEQGDRIGERQKFCVHGIIGARQSGASNEHEYQTQFS